MRFLKLQDDGEFSLIEFIGDNIPRYAILSHTWGADGEEVTFKDLMKGTGKSKAGYQKIRFCGEQAATDGLQYFWADTCCIDKSSSAELSEAINSMFRWYHDAGKCYVYLSDVSIRGSIKNDQFSQWTWEPAFQKSRWFTRGWTLQELIAPASVEFFSVEGERLGDKKLLERQIHEITGITAQALQGDPLSHFSVDERMSWAAKRETKREEDAAYSLLGIFDIHMPLLYGEGRKKALVRLHKEIEETLKDKSPAVPPALFSKHEDAFKRQEADDAPWIVPFERNPRFTGREFQLAKLGKTLFAEGQTAKVAVMGLGGIGKTQLVLELVCRIREKHKNCSVIWIPATNIESLQQAYMDVARQLSIPGWEEDKVDVKRLVQGYLSKESAGRWLLVFDNADDINMWIAKPESEPGSGRLMEYLPRSNQGCIVFTTRDRKTAVKLAHQNVVEVPEMNEEVAKQLLQKYLVNLDLTKNQPDTESLLAQLTYLPLAIVQAAAYINENRITLADYLSLLADQEEEVIDLLSEEFEDDGRYHNVKNPVATTWLISFEQIRHRDPLAADYLSFMACIDPKDIPQSLLPAGASRKKETDAIGTLDAYSFIIKRPADLALDLHRLVHLATRNWLRKEGLITQWTERAISRLEEVFPDHGHKNRSLWRTYLPHSRYALLSDLVDKNGEIRMNLTWRFGMCLYSDGRYNEAEVPFMEVAERRKKVLGAEHPNTLVSMANLASTYRDQGRWKEAEKLFVQVMETRKRVLGEEHPKTLTSMTNLASTYGNQGRWKEAEQLEVQVIETSLKVLGEKHPDTLISMANLASTYRNQGRWKEAEKLEMQVIKTSLKVLGEEHPNTLTSMANLASTYRNQGRWKEAEELEMQVMETRKKVLGEKHPDTLISMANLASAYRNQGRWKEAEELEMQVIETFKKVLGQEHPDTLTSMANLALTYMNQGRWKEAEELFVQVIETRKRVLGEKHPDRLISMTNLASTFWNQGRWKEAEELEVQVMEMRKRMLGEEHPSTMISMNNLAFTWKGQGRDAEALKLMEKCVQLRTRILGVNHPYTLSSSATWNGWQPKRLEIDASTAKVSGNNIMVSQTE